MGRSNLLPPSRKCRSLTSVGALWSFPSLDYEEDLQWEIHGWGPDCVRRSLRSFRRWSPADSLRHTGRSIVVHKVRGMVGTRYGRDVTRDPRSLLLYPDPSPLILSTKFMDVVSRDNPLHTVDTTTTPVDFLNIVVSVP